MGAEEYAMVRARTTVGVDDDYKDEHVEVRCAGELGLGVFARVRIPAGTVLCAAIGEDASLQPVPSNGSSNDQSSAGEEISIAQSRLRAGYDDYMMRLQQKRRVLSQFDASKSSYTRYVNCASPDESAQNAAFEEVDGTWYLVTIKTVERGEQLLVWCAITVEQR